METLIGDGLISGVLDITTTEWADELLGGSRARAGALLKLLPNPDPNISCRKSYTISIAFKRWTSPPCGFRPWHPRPVHVKIPP